MPPLRRTVGAVIAALVLAPAPPAAASPAAPSAEPAARVLVFSKTAGFRHAAAIPDAVEAIERAAGARELAITATEDPSVFTESGLAAYDAVVFLLTTGNVLDGGQQDAFVRFIRAGGGYAGVHSAADTEHAWPWYGRLVGAYFVSHPGGVREATVRVAGPLHPSTRPLPRAWTRTDEWYVFDRDPSAAAHVLARIGERDRHPLAWCREYDGGRSWYTAMGHTRESYADALFVRHLIAGIEYAAGVPRSSEIEGTRRSDVIACTPGADTVYARGGDDDVRTGGRTDRIHAGAGDDRVRAGAGADVVYGGRGADVIAGGPGRDRIGARDGHRDRVECGPGQDVAFVDRVDRTSGCERVVRG